MSAAGRRGLRGQALAGLACLLALAALVPTASAQGQADFALWPGNAGFAGSSLARLGHAVASGDFNGDGLWDIALAAPGARGNAGDVYLFYGSSTLLGDTLLTDPASAADLVIEGEADLQLGGALAAGDINGDGFEDLLIGAPLADAGRGQVWVIFGGANLPPLLSSPDLRITGAASGDECGFALGVAETDNNPGQELLVGSPGADPLGRDSAGRLDLLTGRSVWPASIDLASEASEATLYGVTTAARAGAAICKIPSFGGSLLGGDLDGDGNGDLAFGAPGRGALGRGFAGVVHLFASSESLTDTVDLASGDLLRYRMLIGASGNAQAGSALVSSQLGARRSLLIGSPQAFIAGQQRGAVYEVNWDGISDDARDVDLAVSANHALKFNGVAAGDRLGAAITALGDIWALAMPGRDPVQGAEAGSVVLLYGPPAEGPALAVSDPSLLGLWLSGGAASDQLAGALTVGDYDNDGLFDILLGSGRAASYGGRAYAVRGGLPFAWSFRPAPGEEGVLVDRPVQWLATDPDGSLEPGSVTVTVAGIDYNGSSAELSWSSQGEATLFTLQPASPLPVEVPVQARLRFEDSAGNRSPLHAWQFITGIDNLAPELVGLSPAAGEAGVATTRNVEFSIADEGEGVDISRVSLTVEGELIEWGDPRLSASGDSSEYYFVYNPNSDFPADSPIDVTLRAADLLAPSPNIMSPFSYVFYTSSDTVAPVVSQISPPPGAVLDVSSSIQALLLDESAGVDSSATEMALYENGSAVGRLAALSFRQISGALQLRHNPAASQLLTPGPLTVELASADLANPPNVLDPPEQWSYTVVEDETAPFLLEASPAASSEDAPRNTPVRVAIADQAAGVDSSSLTMSIDGQLLSHSELSITPVTTASYRGWSIRYSPPPASPWGDSVSVELAASDLAQTANDFSASYRFTTVGDTLPPSLLLVDPPQGATAVVVTDSLIWELSDDLTGVDPGSAYLTIDSLDRSSGLSYVSGGTQPGAEYRFRYLPAQPFSYEDTLSVLFGVSDLSTETGGPNLRTINYQLITEPDADPPYLASARPRFGERNVARNADIVAEVKDRGLGVEADSLLLLVEGVPADASDLSVTAIDSGYQIRYNPTGMFEYSDSIGVRLVAWDRAREPNRLLVTEQQWWFVTLSDDQGAPELADASPPDSSTGLPVQSPFQFSLLDDGAGVDTLATVLLEDDATGWPHQQSIELLPGGVRYTIAPPEGSSWTWSDTLQLSILTRDLSQPPNEPSVPPTLTLFVERDDSAPLILAEPGPDSVAVFGSPLVIDLVDEQAGVDSASLALSVDGADVLAPARVVQTGNTLRLLYRPNPAWPAGSTVAVDLSASDRAANQNSVQQSWSFAIAPDTLAPVLALDEAQPAPGASNLSASDTVMVSLSDPGIGVDGARSELRLAGRSFAPELADSALGRWVFVVPLAQLELFAGQQLVASVEAWDLAEPPNRMETVSWSYTLAPPDEDFVLVPTTFTPNGDGVWDELLVYHSGPAGTEMTVYDLRGRAVAHRSGSPAVWDGTDDEGQPLAGGLYIVQLEAGEQLHSASVALAR